MKRILVASDFSNCAGNAMEYAMELAKILNMDVYVIHAIGVTEGVFNNIYNAIYIEDYYNKKRQALAAWANAYTSRDEFKNIRVTTLCDVGSLSGVISNYIKSNPVELLVIGTMGATGILGLFGSNASLIVEKIKTPTLIIPTESKFSKDPVITFATDFSSNLSGEDVEALNVLLEAFGSEKINVLNVNESAEPGSNEAGENVLKNLINKAKMEFTYISKSNAVDGIMNFIDSSQTDILFLVKRHYPLIYRIFNRSTVNQVMNRSVKAILVLHEYAPVTSPGKTE
jgi:nucleotide-binding universal stress UspA family protein